MAELRDLSDGSGRFISGGALSKAIAAMDKSMGEEAMAEVARSADRLVASAKSGGFTVTKEAADRIIKVIEEHIDEIDQFENKLEVFDQEPELGDHDYGKLVARHMWEAANDGQSARVALGSLKIILEKSREALLRASKQYQEQEEVARDAFRGAVG
ncbi:hypothetical protein SAXI111661_04905 [Saccharomonospora xinjiangensis]|uniref:hypothetical protein n=1 Tax=Saccharomonospora xinjiangensis TaxID=75294 RepID=UPI00106F24F5|nr:hypothetical protein [Saccharomonospora xinjiangensis]QBQ58960.1 hypothetical protein EYD13_02885 [Saccharomonospora xinjiangensis]